MNDIAPNPSAMAGGLGLVSSLAVGFVKIILSFA
jgi:hypothetical protein